MAKKKSVYDNPYWYCNEETTKVFYNLKATLPTMLPHWNMKHLYDGHLKEMENPFPSNHPDIFEVQSNMDNLEHPFIFMSFKDLVKPMMYNYFLQAYEMAPFQKRPKLEADFISAMTKYRRDEMTLIKMSRCLQRGKLDRYQRICSDLLRRKMVSKLVPGAQDLKMYLETIQRLHREGHKYKRSGQKRNNMLSFEMFDFSDDTQAFSYPLKIAAQLDSGSSVLAINGLKTRLEQSYRADLHDLLLELTQIVAQSKEISPLIYGRHPLPRDLKNMTAKLKHQPSGEELNLWLEKVAQMLDTAQPDPEHWLLLKQLMVSLLQMTDQEEAQVIFRSVFDAMRIKVWSKIHLKVDPDRFATNLFTKLFDVSNPSTRDLIVIYANIASDLTTKLKRRKTDNESQLTLSKNYSYHHPNYNKILFHSINVKRESVDYDHLSEELIKLHINLRAMEDLGCIPDHENTNSVQYPFSNLNFRRAHQALHKKNNRISEKLAQEGLHSFHNFIYFTSASHATRMFLDYNSVKKFTKSQVKEVKKVLTFKIKQVAMKKSRKELFRACQRRLRSEINYKPFKKICQSIRDNKNEIAQVWDIPEDIIIEALDLLEKKIKRANLLKYTIRYVSLANLDYAVHLSTCLTHYFQPLFID